MASDCGSMPRSSRSVYSAYSSASALAAAIDLTDDSASPPSPAPPPSEAPPSPPVRPAAAPATAPAATPPPARAERLLTAGANAIITGGAYHGNVGTVVSLTPEFALVRSPALGTDRRIAHRNLYVLSAAAEAADGDTVQVDRVLLSTLASEIAKLEADAASDAADAQAELDVASNTLRREEESHVRTRHYLEQRRLREEEAHTRTRRLMDDDGARAAEQFAQLTERLESMESINNHLQAEVRLHEQSVDVHSAAAAQLTQQLADLTALSVDRDMRLAAALSDLDATRAAMREMQQQSTAAAEDAEARGRTAYDAACVQLQDRTRELAAARSDRLELERRTSSSVIHLQERHVADLRALELQLQNAQQHASLSQAEADALRAERDRFLADRSFITSLASGNLFDQVEANAALQQFIAESREAVGTSSARLEEAVAALAAERASLVAVAAERDSLHLQYRTLRLAAEHLNLRLHQQQHEPPPLQPEQPSPTIPHRPPRHTVHQQQHASLQPMAQHHRAQSPPPPTSDHRTHYHRARFPPGHPLRDFPPPGHPSATSPSAVAPPPTTPSEPSAPAPAPAPAPALAPAPAPASPPAPPPAPAPSTVLTSGHPNIGFTADEIAILTELLAGKTLADAVTPVLTLAVDRTGGAVPHRLSLPRLAPDAAERDVRLSRDVVRDIMAGTVLLFPKQLEAEATRGAVWRGSGTGSRISVVEKLATVCRNGIGAQNVLDALSIHLRAADEHCGAPLATSLQRSYETVKVENFIHDPRLPLNMLLEIVMSQFDTVMVGQTTASGGDAARQYRTFQRAGSLLATAKTLTVKAVANFDPNGHLHLTDVNLWDDFERAVQVQDKFLSLYSDDSSYKYIVRQLHAAFSRSRVSFAKRSSDVSAASLMSIVGHAQVAVADEEALKAFPDAAPPRAPARVNAVHTGGAPAPAPGPSASLPPHPFASRGRPASGQPAGQQSPGGSSSGRPVPAGRYAFQVMAAMRAAGFEQSQVESVFYIGNADGTQRCLVDLPDGLTLSEWLQIAEVRHDRLVKLLPSADAQTKKTLSLINPRRPYGGRGEDALATFTDHAERASKIEGTEEWTWRARACPTCAYAPPCVDADGNVTPCPKTDDRWLWRNGEGDAHNPKRCPGRKCTAIAADLENDTHVCAEIFVARPEDVEKYRAKRASAAKGRQ